MTGHHTSDAFFPRPPGNLRGINADDSRRWDDPPSDVDRGAHRRIQAAANAEQVRNGTQFTSRDIDATSQPVARREFQGSRREKERGARIEEVPRCANRASDVMSPVDTPVRRRDEALAAGRITSAGSPRSITSQNATQSCAGEAAPTRSGRMSRRARGLGLAGGVFMTSLPSRSSRRAALVENRPVPQPNFKHARVPDRAFGRSGVSGRRRFGELRLRASAPRRRIENNFHRKSRSGRRAAGPPTQQARGHSKCEPQKEIGASRQSRTPQGEGRGSRHGAASRPPHDIGYTCCGAGCSCDSIDTTYRRIAPWMSRRSGPESGRSGGPNSSRFRACRT